VTEQVWFRGSRRYRGEYIPFENRAAPNPEALDDITLDWMLRRLLHYFPQFPAKPGAWRAPGSHASVAQQQRPESECTG